MKDGTLGDTFHCLQAEMLEMQKNQVIFFFVSLQWSFIYTFPPPFKDAATIMCVLCLELHDFFIVNCYLDYLR